jgi:hypothetical protein
VSERWASYECFVVRDLHVGTWGVVEYPPDFYDLGVYEGTTGVEKDAACCLDMLVTHSDLGRSIDNRG